MAPEALVNPVVLTNNKDANLYNDLITGRVVTGVHHLINTNCNRSVVYSSECVAAQIATDQIMDVRSTLRNLGVPMQGKSYIFGDNQSVITNSTVPHSLTKRRHDAMSYHRFRKAIAANILGLNYKIAGDFNTTDFLSKHYCYTQA